MVFMLGWGCCQECLSGEKVTCLCITEASAGSDVAGLACRADDAGDHFVVNGEMLGRYQA